ncbi:hypothetical protein DYB32_008531 [Aphanomyces invadans]|uniref:Uncharacterized protein n=1 Tax=Aphanomyces invadans TaxID=157072 RepID=A0A418AKV5_9STRA|nr:hypothetical protein DYB32_008531 [Aphanomyces invadans]
MRFLAGLVHAAVASQVVFDSHDPLLPADRKGNMGSFGEYVSKYRQAAVRFRSPKAVDDACIEGPTIKNVTFTMDTVDVPPNTCLRVALCPSVNGAKLL